MKEVLAGFILYIAAGTAIAAELGGVSVDDQIQSISGETLVLNGMGLREKLWVDVYVGSLYLSKSSQKVEEILAQSTPYRVQLDFIYKKVEAQKLLDAWREGFGKNQDEQSLSSLQSRIDQFYAYFTEDAVAKDQYVFEYIPGQGTRTSKNGTTLGTIEGEDFKNALLEIWLGNSPADKNLKKGMLGL